MIKNCEICNEEFKTFPSINKKTCSRKCLSLLYSKIIKLKGGPHNKIAKKDMLSKACLVCEKDFKVLPCHGNKILCSKNCQLKYRAILGAKGCKSISKPQQIIYDIIKINYPDAILSDTSLLKYKEVDILIPSLKTAIEVQGRVHYEAIFGLKTFKRVKKSDKTKKTLLKKLGYKLIELDVRERKEKVLLEYVYNTLINSGIAVFKID